MLAIDERDLLARLQEGDKNAFVAIYDRYKDALAMRLLYLLKSEALAEEALQDLFVKIWDRRATIEPDKSFKAYLFRIAESITYDIFRKASLQRNVFAKLMDANDGWYTHIEETIIHSENSQILDAMLQRLPSKRRKIFVACKLEGKGYKEVAQEYGISTTTVNDHIQKATQYLKSYAKSLDRVQFSILIACLLISN